jgi:hypothetical protein
LLKKVRTNENAQMMSRPKNTQRTMMYQASDANDAMQLMSHSDSHSLFHPSQAGRKSNKKQMPGVPVSKGQANHGHQIYALDQTVYPGIK